MPVFQSSTHFPCFSATWLWMYEEDYQVFVVRYQWGRSFKFLCYVNVMSSALVSLSTCLLDTLMLKSIDHEFIICYFSWFVHSQVDSGTSYTPSRLSLALSVSLPHLPPGLMACSSFCQGASLPWSHGKISGFQLSFGATWELWEAWNAHPRNDILQALTVKA